MNKVAEALQSIVIGAHQIVSDIPVLSTITSLGDGFAKMILNAAISNSDSVATNRIVRHFRDRDNLIIFAGLFPVVGNAYNIYKQKYDDPEYMKQAIEKTNPAEIPELLKKGTNNIRNDKEIVLAAVQKNGMALEFASDTLQNDAEVVIAAVIQNNNANKFASSDLQVNESRERASDMPLQPRQIAFAIIQKSPRRILDDNIRKILDAGPPLTDDECKALLDAAFIIRSDTTRSFDHLRKYECMLKANKEFVSQYEQDHYGELNNSVHETDLLDLQIEMRRYPPLPT